ncbi:MAG: DUF3047 domain-containing protein, partial [Acidobacteria bacterium]
MRRVGWRFASSVIVVGVMLATAAWAASEEIQLLGSLSATGADALPPGWQPLVFRKVPSRTRYSIVPHGAGQVVKAESHAAASGLLRPLDADPKT